MFMKAGRDEELFFLRKAFIRTRLKLFDFAQKGVLKICHEISLLSG